MDHPIGFLCKVFVAGVVSTFTMTLFVDLLSRLFSDRFYVPSILGKTLNLKSPGFNTGFGTAIHYAIGICFAATFYYLWFHFPDWANWWGVLLAGAICGGLAVIVWRLVLYAYPGVLVKDKGVYLFSIFCGHLVFGLTAWLIWQWVVRQ